MIEIDGKVLLDSVSDNTGRNDPIEITTPRALIGAGKFRLTKG